MILGSDNRKAWSDLDILIMQAYEILEAERCECGQYTWICRNTDPLIDWKVKPIPKCDAALAAEDFDERRKGKDDDEVLRGRPYPTIRNDAFRIGDLRQKYYDQLRAEEEAEEPDAAKD